MTQGKKDGKYRTQGLGRQDTGRRHKVTWKSGDKNKDGGDVSTKINN